MDINTEQRELENTQNVKKSLFDCVEVKGISLKSAKAFFSGRFASLLRSISRLFSFTSSRVYGLSLLSFGILTLFLHLGEYYFMDDPQVEMSSLVIGAAAALLSLLFLFSDKPICIAIQSVKLFDFIVFDFFSINRTHQNDGRSRINGSVGIIFGFLLAVLGFFVPTEYTVLLIVGLLLVITAMVSPEFTYILSLFLFPYLPALPYSSYILAILIAITVISFARKVFVGKRIYSFEIYDFIFVILILTVFVTAVILGGASSTENALLITAFLFGYFPASNMAVNRRIFDCVAGAISASAIPIGIHSIVGYVISLVEGSPVHSRAFFSSPEVFSAYLSAVAVFSLYLAVKRSRPLKKNYYFSVFVLTLITLFTTGIFVVLIALLLGVISLSVIRSRKIPVWCLIFIVPLPIAMFFLDSSVLASISDMFFISPSLENRRLLFDRALDVFFENPIFGIGANNPWGLSDFSSNVYLSLACRFGALALMAVFILLVLRVSHFALFKKYFSDSTISFYAEISMLVWVCMLVIGGFSDIFADIEMLYFFIAVFSVGSAALRLAKKEKEEMIIYYRELGTSDLAEIDITLKK